MYPHWKADNSVSSLSPKLLHVVLNPTGQIRTLSRNEQCCADNLSCKDPARSAVGIQCSYSVPVVGHCTWTACHPQWSKYNCTLHVKSSTADVRQDRDGMTIAHSSSRTGCLQLLRDNDAITRRRYAIYCQENIYLCEAC